MLKWYVFYTITLNAYHIKKGCNGLKKLVRIKKLEHLFVLKSDSVDVVNALLIYGADVLGVYGY